MKIVKHCQEEAAGGTDLVQGVLLGLVVDNKLEITNCFPFPRHNDEEEFNEGIFFMQCTVYGRWCHLYEDRISGVMVVMLTLSVVDNWFELRSGPTKDYEIGICCFSTKHAVIRSKSNETGRLVIGIMLPHGTSCLYMWTVVSVK